MTLWSDFLRRLMLGATLSGAAAAGADDGVAAARAAEIGDAKAAAGKPGTPAQGPHAER